ncbi:MAG: alpha/beta fold hydrolase [SAR324 cluster bacterium]|nr:alpha/beta fold hydrolase [SAR324 cluster bacterium]
MKLAPLVGLLLLLASCIAIAAPKKPEPDQEVVVLIHGYGRSKMAMWSLETKLEQAGYFVANVGYSSLTQDLQGIKNETFAQIQSCCVQLPNQVHFVGHSMGGLLIRSYLAEHRPKYLGRVVLLGSPNKGTEVADHFKDHPLVGLAGPVASKLGTAKDSFPNSLPLPDYPVGVIAGAVNSGKQSGTSKILPGEDDGMVTVESAKLEGMTDFILMPVAHYFMRSNKEVAKQIIHFLKVGKFQK